MDPHSRALLQRYQKNRARLHRLGCRLGHTRAATLTRDLGERKACVRLGRCLWGCPVDALYTPSITLRELQRNRRFRYEPGGYVTHFECHPGSSRIGSVVARSIADGAVKSIPVVDQLALGAGTLSTARIFLESVRRARGTVERLDGLMDNRQVLMPFVNLSMLGKPWEPDHYQYHQLVLALDRDDPATTIHGQITTLKTALIHGIVQGLPFDLKTSLWVFRHLHAALGLVNVNLHDERRAESQVGLEPDGHGGQRLVVRYQSSADEPARIQEATRRMRKVLWQLGCIVPPGMTHVRPMGASVHYAGTLPMTNDARPFTTTPRGQSRDFVNLWIVDGSTLPFLPARNVTFTLMANAARVAAGM
jgi:choline dehydrogenase-like flavoprotein